MPITTDYIIFADRYHKKQHLPDDLIKTIMDIRTEKIKIEKEKIKYNKVVQELKDFKYYFENNVVNNITYDTAVNLTKNKSLEKKPGDEGWVEWRDAGMERWEVFDNAFEMTEENIVEDFMVWYHYEELNPNAEWYFKEVGRWDTPIYCIKYCAYRYLFYIMAVTDKNFVF